MNASDSTNPSTSNASDLNWLWWLVGGTAVAGVGGIVLASYAGKKAAQLLPYYEAYQRAEGDEEQAARARSLARAAAGDSPWLLKRANRVLGLEDLDFAPAPVAAPRAALPQTIRVTFHDPYALRANGQGLSEQELKTLSSWLKFGSHLTIEINLQTMSAMVLSGQDAGGSYRPPVRGRSAPKFEVTFKDPSALQRATERLPISKQEQEALQTALSRKWFEYGEYVTIEVNPRTMTARVIPL